MALRRLVHVHTREAVRARHTDTLQLPRFLRKWQGYPPRRTGITRDVATGPTVVAPVQEVELLPSSCLAFHRGLDLAPIHIVVWHPRGPLDRTVAVVDRLLLVIRDHLGEFWDEGRHHGRSAHDHGLVGGMQVQRAAHVSAAVRREEVCHAFLAVIAVAVARRIAVLHLGIGAAIGPISLDDPLHVEDHNLCIRLLPGPVTEAVRKLRLVAHLLTGMMQVREGTR